MNERDAAIERLARAVAFLDLARSTPGAAEVGALRDAREGLEVAARDVVKATRRERSSLAVFI